MIIAQHKRKETERDKARKERKERKGKRRRKARKQRACFQKEEEGIHTKKVLRKFSPPEDSLKTAATYSPTCTQYHRRGEA